MNEQQLSQHIEALLFVEGGSLKKSELAKLLAVELSVLEAALVSLKDALVGRGVVLVDDSTFVELRTSPQVAQKIEELRKEELSKDIGKAGLEVLACIMYRGPLTRAEVDFIRGVNSSQTLRTLLMRGLIRKVPNPKDERSFLYEATTETLSQLGIVHIGELPEHAEVKAKLSALEESFRTKSQEETSHEH